jgi:archaellum biogenesis ATPase FlaH
MPAALDEIEAVAANSAVGSFRIPTGFDDLDALLGGWSQGCLIVVGGRPSSGKTTLLLNFCRTASIKYRIPSMLISGEMNSRELQTRIFSAEARVPLHTIRTGRMSDEDWSRLAGIMRALADAPIRLGAESGFRIEQIKTDAVRVAQQSSLKLLLVDGLQSITKYAGTGDTSTTEASLWGLKNLAEALKIPIIITAQAERHNTGPPTGSAIQHLRDSDAIERVADVVIMLDRPDQDDRESVRAGEADLIVVKNRNGPQATVTVGYQYHYCRFISMAPDYDYPLFRAEQTAKPLASNHDRKLFHRLLKQIPPDGQVIDWLKNNFMLKALPVRHFETIEQIAKALSLEVVGFDDKDANDRYVDFRSAVNDFCSKISYHTWRDNGNWLEVPTGNWIGAPASLVSQAGVVTAGRVVDGVRFVSVFGSWRVPAAGPAAALI